MIAIEHRLFPFRLSPLPLRPGLPNPEPMVSMTWMKRYLPRRLFSRALLIMFVPVFGLQIVVAIVFIQRHFEGVTRQMATAVGAELNYVLTTL
ncbi:MAG: hypothetical protein AAFQ33_16620, partial [Pseudomonadota bacterium]